MYPSLLKCDVRYTFKNIPEYLQDIVMQDLFFMNENTDNDSFQSASTFSSSTTRFSEPPVSDEQLHKTFRQAEPQKTQSANKWGVGVYMEWARWRNERPETQCAVNTALFFKISQKC